MGYVGYGLVAILVLEIVFQMVTGIALVGSSRWLRVRLSERPGQRVWHGPVWVRRSEDPRLYRVTLINNCVLLGVVFYFILGGPFPQLLGYWIFCGVAGFFLLCMAVLLFRLIHSGNWREILGFGAGRTVIAAPGIEMDPQVLAFLTKATIFCTVWTLGVLSLFIFCGVPPLLHAWESMSWAPVPCRIVSSGVVGATGRRHVIYAPNVIYAYTYKGRSYQSNGYRFMYHDRSQEGATQVVSQFPVGLTTNCFVDPAEPSQAVLVRGFSRAWPIYLLPLIFTGIGIGCIIFSIRLRRGGFSIV